MPQKILGDNWSDYDDLKKKKQDANFFACEEKWEVDYLVNKIRKIYPQYSEQSIRTAISGCCAEIRPPRPRTVFVTCVMRRLRS